MKNKAPLALMELVIMILIFALAAALCLQAFLWSRQQSEDIVRKDAAVLAVQNAAELLKESRGDMAALEAAAPELSGEIVLFIEPEDTGIDGLGGAIITARAADGEGSDDEKSDREGEAAEGSGDEELFTVRVRWQEPLEGGGGHE